MYSDEIEIDGVDVPSGDVLLAGLFGYGAANTAFGGLAIILVDRRELGILKRLRATPMPPATYFAAVLLSMLVIFALEAVALLVLGRLVFDASPPENWLGFAVRSCSASACFAGLGFGAAALIRSAEGVSAVVNVVLLPMAFLSGAFGPTRDYPGFLQAIADVLPLTYFLEVVNGIYLDGDSFFADPVALAIVAALGRRGARRRASGASAGCRESGETTGPGCPDPVCIRDCATCSEQRQVVEEHRHRRERACDVRPGGCVEDALHACWPRSPGRGPCSSAGPSPGATRRTRRAASRSGRAPRPSRARPRGR